MGLKVITTTGLFLLFFFGEIAVSFSNKRESNRNNALSSNIPLSSRLDNSLSNKSEFEGVDSIFSDFIERYNIVGGSLAISKNGQLIYAKGFGLAEQEDQDSVSPRSLFRIASVSKLITAVAIMKLVEDEKISINSKVFGPKGILNDSVFRNYTDIKYEDITVHQLLNHTAGWNGKRFDPVFNSLYIAQVMQVPPPATMPVIIEYALNRKLDYLPGKNYSYSNLGYCILGEVIEKVTGMTYEDYVQFAILHPLGIFDMHIGKSLYSEKYPYEVHYYDNSENIKVWAFNGSKEMVDFEYGGNNMELLGAAGGWVASAAELAKLIVAIDGFPSRPDILSKRTIRYMTETQERTRSLIGWRGADGRGTWWRTGTLAGTTALVMRHANGINWVVLLNTTSIKRRHIHNELSQTMYRALRSVPNWPQQDLFTFEPAFSSHSFGLPVGSE